MKEKITDLFRTGDLCLFKPRFNLLNVFNYFTQKL